MKIIAEERRRGIFIPATVRDPGASGDGARLESVGAVSPMGRTVLEKELEGWNQSLSEVQELIIEKRRNKRIEPVIWEALKDKEAARHF